MDMVFRRSFLLIYLCQFAYASTPVHDPPILGINDTGTFPIRHRRSLRCSTSSSRIDCGWSGMGPELCEQVGCCWDTSKGGPFCYIGEQGICEFTGYGTCDFRNPLKTRSDCGFNRIGKSACELRGCCFDSRIRGAYNCFYPDPAGVTPVKSAVQTAPISECELESDVEGLRSKFKDVISAIGKLKERILAARKDYNIAKTVGASVSTAGTVAIISGIVLAPFTAGLSLGLTAGGAAGAVLGGATSLTASLMESGKAEEWADELARSVGSLEKKWKEIMDKLGRYKKQQEMRAQDIITPIIGGGLIGGIADGIFFSKAGVDILQLEGVLLELGTGTAGVAASTTASVAGTTSSAASVMSGTTATGASVTTAGISTAGAALSAGGAVLGVVSIGVNVYSIVDMWANDPAMVTHANAIVDGLQTKTKVLGELEEKLEEACEKKCKGGEEKMMEFFGRNRNKRETHARMGTRTCVDIDAEWRLQYTRADSFALPVGDGSPINFVGYKTVMRPGNVFHVVAQVHAEIVPQNIRQPGDRLNFGEEWNQRMVELEQRQGDEKGHLLGNKIGGPIRWYNLAPMTARVNRNVGNGGGQGMSTMENLVRNWLEQGCGMRVSYDIYLNYEQDYSARPKGFKVCLVFHGRQRLLRGSYYFNNEI